MLMSIIFFVLAAFAGVVFLVGAYLYNMEFEDYEYEKRDGVYIASARENENQWVSWGKREPHKTRNPFREQGVVLADGESRQIAINNMLRELNV